MAITSVSELRRNLQAFLSQVAAGERIRITAHGRIIAEIGPPSAEPDVADAARQRLRGSVLAFDRPLEPAFAIDEWQMLK
jgi:antitoxin (DNA-binding transcriptional repressor) of toxin-antitoxin stability system